MEFLSDPTWWGLLCIVVVAAVAPSFFQKIRLIALAASTILCLTVITGMFFLHGATAAITGLIITIFAGLGALTYTLALTGIHTMMKKRYR